MRLLAALLAAALPLASPAAEPDDDFSASQQLPSIALGPMPRGGVVSSASVGWLRSELQVQLGLGSWLDLLVRGDAMLLYDGFNAQNGLYAGLRVSPLDPEGMFRLTFSIEAGELFIPIEVGMKTIPLVRGELAAGITIDPVSVYGRYAARAQSGKSAYEDSNWVTDGEAGLGAEFVAWKHLIVGAEVYAWSRPDAETLWNWRLRVGWSR